MRSNAIVFVALLSACFSAPPNAGSSSGTSGRSVASTNGSTSTATDATGTTVGSTSTGMSGTTGHATSSSGHATGTAATTTGTSATATNTAATTSTSTGTVQTAATSSGATTTASNSSGTTGGMCDVNQPCPQGALCDVSLTACPQDPGSNVSNGGVCQPLPACATSGSTCEGVSCTQDSDCDQFEACSNGTCSGFACPGLTPECDPGCSIYSEPHSCNEVCVCSSCGAVDDGGSMGTACDLNNPCPLGSDCIYTTQACPPVPGDGSPALDLGGTCSPEVVCPGGTCEGIACSQDTDCSDDEFCSNGTCQILECPPVPAFCFAPGCTTTTDPHSCSPYCLCPACPSTVDAGGSTCNCPFGNVPGFQCCGATCVDVEEDTENCNGCGLKCGAGEICQNGACTTASCSLNSGCLDIDGGSGPATCCGSECCGAGSICCQVEEGVEYLACFDADAGCPLGCPLCD